MHTLAVLADTFPADEQEQPLLARGTAVFLRADDAARAVAPHTSAHCQPGRGWKVGGTGREMVKPRTEAAQSASGSILTEHTATQTVTTFPTQPDVVM